MIAHSLNVFFISVINVRTIKTRRGHVLVDLHYPSRAPTACGIDSHLTQRISCALANKKSFMWIIVFPTCFIFCRWIVSCITRHIYIFYLLSDFYHVWTTDEWVQHKWRGHIWRWRGAFIWGNRIALGKFFTIHLN